jgi:predicted esterase
MPELIGLIAPRKLFIEAGNRDHLFPIAEVKVAFNRLQEIYQSFDAETALSADFFSGGHEINGEKSYDWLVDNL